jgi:glycosyltransferase involved in cell wall biosynthesis
LRAANGLRRNLAEHLCDWLETRQVLEADASFAPSEFMTNTFARLEGHKPLTIRTVSTLESFSLDSSFFDQYLRDKKYLLYFGTLNRIKGVDLLSPVIGAILDRHPAIEFVFIGRDHGLGNGKGAFEVLRNANKPHAKRLSYHAALSKPLLYPAIANALGVLMPSRVDNYPNACLEAQALGTPVVGTYDSSLEEMIVEGETGFLARNCDPGSFREAVERLLALPDAERCRMRQSILVMTAGRAKEDRVGQHLELYQRVIKEFSGKRSR